MKLSAYEIPEGYMVDNSLNEKANYTFMYNNEYPETIEFIVYIIPETITATTTYTTTTINSHTLYGDVNNDNKVTISDSILMMQSLINAYEYKLSDAGKINGDVYNNGDGITNMDALVIQKVVANKISESDLPVK